MMKTLDAVIMKMIKFFSNTKIDTHGEYRNLVSCYFLFIRLQLIRGEKYDLSEIQRVILLLNKELLYLKKNSKSLEKEGITYEWLEEIGSFSREIYQNLISLENQPDENLYHSLTEKVFVFCKEHEDLKELWREELHKYHRGTFKVMFVLGGLILSLFYSSFLLTYSAPDAKAVYEDELGSIDLEEEIIKKVLDKTLD